MEKIGEKMLLCSSTAMLQFSFAYCQNFNYLCNPMSLIVCLFTAENNELLKTGSENHLIYVLLPPLWEHKLLLISIVTQL